MPLPIYEMMINPEETSDVEVSFVALVDKPAIERNFMTFKSQTLNFAVDADKRIISGPAMVADVPIYRKDQGGEYNVFFSAATIKEIALKFAKKGYAKNLNLFHDPTMPAEGVTIFNSFVSDKAIGVLPMAGFEDLPDGSWFITAKVESEEIWQRIKAGEFKGFSVEGNFSFKKSEQNEDFKYLQESGIMQDIKTLLSTLKTALFNADVPPPPAAPAPAPVAAEAVKAKLKDGTEISVSELVAGGVVMIGDAPAPVGEHELEDGTKITVGEGGVITAVTPGVAAPPADYTKEFAAVNEKFAGYEQRFAAYETKFQEQAQAIAKAQAINEQLFAIVQKLAEAPTADPASGGGNNFSSQYSEDKAERLRNIQASLNKLKTA
jgi:hypothetical protein